MYTETLKDFYNIGTFTREQKDRYIEHAHTEKSKYIMVVCDTFDYEDYPVFVKDDEDLARKYKDYNGVNMQRVMGIYSLK